MKAFVRWILPAAVLWLACNAYALEEIDTSTSESLEFHLDTRVESLTVVAPYGANTVSGWDREIEEAQGDYYFPLNTVVSVTNTEDQVEAMGRAYHFFGFWGFGAAPKKGTEDSVTFTLSDDSAVVWNWGAVWKPTPASNVWELLE